MIRQEPRLARTSLKAKPIEKPAAPSMAAKDAVLTPKTAKDCIIPTSIMVTCTKLIIRLTRPMLVLYLSSNLVSIILTNLATKRLTINNINENIISGNMAVSFSLYIPSIVVCFSIVFSILFISLYF